ncbi:molybdopterin-dependent oxidoreductase [Candidatus Bathyarchaeota archaeon]|nr:molybdopterin-dependent oxidoreductase [Candidatus Bathyarchaeota archaeon]
MGSVVPVSCDLDCGGGCPLQAHVEGGWVTMIVDNPLGGPYMSGCVKGLQMHRVLHAPDRLKRPLLRTGPRGSGEFKEVGWPEALDLVAERLTEIRDRYGNEAIIRLGGSGACNGALHNTGLLTMRFLSQFGGYTDIEGYYSSQAAQYVTPYVLGTRSVGIDPGTLQHTGLIILWGANISDTRLEVPMEARIREAKVRGVEVIVVDPRRTTTAKTLGTQWISVRPGTDTALMLAVLHVLIEEDLVDRGFVERYSVGFKELERYVLGEEDGAPKNPAWAEEICGTPADVIVQLARQWGQTHPTAFIPGLSIQRTVGGEEAIRMAIALQVATGNLGVLGGSSGGLTWGRLPSPRIGVIGAPQNPTQVSIPAYQWPDAILEGRRGGYSSDIKAIYNVGGNFLIQGSDVNKNIRAFSEVEFSVCHERFMTPTAKYCDVVLPVTTFLERSDIVVPDGGNYLLFSSQAVPPLYEARNDYDIFCELAERLGFRQEYSEGRGEEEWLRDFVADSEVADYEEFKREGLYMGGDQLRVGLSDFVADPEAHPLGTPSGRVQILSEAYADLGFTAVPAYRGLRADDRHPLMLVTPKSRFRVNSQNDNIPWFRERELHGLWMNPRDAEERGIDDGGEVQVSSPEGRVRVTVIVTEDIMPGVVCLLEGVWPIFDSEGVDTAGSANFLTSTVPTEPSKGSRTHSILVQVTKA